MCAIKFCVVMLGLLVVRIEGLKCIDGYALVAQNPLIPPLNSFNEEECPTIGTQRCLRGEGRFSARGFVFDVVMAGCVEEQMCEEECETLLSDTLTGRGGGVAVFTPNQVGISVCESICCNTNSCNNNTVAEILQQVESTTVGVSALETEGNCLLPPKHGPCRGNFVRWFFNAKTRKCQTFGYGGCLGNNNRFRSARACRQRCGSRPVCFLPRVSGPCKAKIPAWGFNAKTRQCEQFYYGGCRGNNNRFPTRAACSSHCENVCRLPKVLGPCRGSLERWYHNSKTRKCEKFIYGGCKGNRNNFKTKAACEARC